MRLYQRVTRLALVCMISGGPALAQSASPRPAAPAPAIPSAPAQSPSATGAPPAQTSPGGSAQIAPNSPASNEAFLTGLRRVGVMAGQVVACSTEKDKQAQISQAMDLANLIAIHFGLKAAFTFVGALGYGSGNPFDKAGCPQAIDGWKQIKAKYLNK